LVSPRNDLASASRNVVYDGVAEDVLVRLLHRDVIALPPDDDTQFHFVIELVVHGRSEEGRRSGTDDGMRGFQKKLYPIRLGPIGFVQMVIEVGSPHQQHPGPQRSQQPYLLGGISQRARRMPLWGEPPAFDVE